MKKMNKKGFTLVELVIVIAVIAILAAVLIPVFSNIIGKANESAALADARTVYEQYVVDTAQAKEEIPSDLIIKVDDKHFFVVKDGVFNTEPKDDEAAAKELFGENVTTENVKEYNGKIVYTVKAAESNG